jgi:NifU-like protein involved in Fe-S cluster formation/bacterioferritin-associated ferredoxin
MPIYPVAIAKRCAEQKHSGNCANASVVGRSASFECGTLIEIALRIEPESKSIEEVRYRTSGCGYMIAAGESIGRLFEQRRLSELHGKDEIDALLLSAFPELPLDRRHCVSLAVDAFRGALAEFRLRYIEEFRGEKALICTCFGVDEDTIGAILETDNVSNVEEVAAICNAGRGCGSCQMLIQEMIDERHTF